ncbi:MAG: hypothetical protein ACYTFI_18355 [Planctomycetota bacterium]
MNERYRRIAALPALFAAPTVVLLVTGIVFGFPLEGLLLGAGIGCGLAGARELSRRRATGFDVLLLPAGGAAGAALVTFVFGVRYLPQLASAAAFGWGAGLAAAVFLRIFRDRPRRRIVYAALAAVAIAFVSLPFSFAPLVSYAGLLVGVSLVMFVVGLELARRFLSPGRTGAALAAAAGSGAAVGIVFGLVGNWWFNLAGRFTWLVLESPWLTAAAGGMVFGLLFALFVRLGELVAEKSRRKRTVAAAVAGMSVAFGVSVALYVGKDGLFSLARNSVLDDLAAAVGYMAAFMVIVHLIRTRATGLRMRLVAHAAVFLPLGVLWIGAWPTLAPSVTSTAQARSLLAMVRWGTSLGTQDERELRLVHYAYAGLDYTASRRAQVFGAPENAGLARRFRCVIFPYADYKKLIKGLKLKYPPFAVFLTPDGEEIDALWGG